MITYTQHGYGAGLWRKGMEIGVLILDHFEDIASVKVVTPHYYEYLHLAKTGDGWGYVILQVDSLTPWKLSSICAGGMIAMEMLSHRVMASLPVMREIRTTKDCTF